MIVEIMVSRREGQVTFAVSALTCWRNVNGLTVLDAICRSVFKEPFEKGPLVIPFPGQIFCRLASQNHLQRVPKSAPNQRFSFTHAFRTRKAGFPAPRAARLSG
jgi:hypothetical protein